VTIPARSGDDPIDAPQWNAVFMLGFGGLRGWLAGTLTCLGLSVLLVVLLVFVPWLNPAFVILPLVLVPVAIMWRKESRADRTPAAGPAEPTDQHRV